MKRNLLKIMLTSTLAATMCASLVACGSSGSSGTTGATAANQSGSATSTSNSEQVNANSDGTVNNPEAVQIKSGDLSFWSLFTGGDGEWWQKIVSDYNNTSPTYPVQCVTLVWADYYTKLQTAVAAGKGPDMGISHVSKLYELASTGVIEPLDDYLKDNDIDLTKYYSQKNIDAVTIDDHIYAIPLDTHAEVMYYNTDLISQAGITEDDIANIKSIDDFKDMLKKCKDTLGSDYTPLCLSNSGDDPFRVWYALYYQMGGAPFVNDDATKCTLDKDKAEAAMKALKDLYDEGYIQKGINSDDNAVPFQSGKAAFLFGGTWLTGTLESTKGLNFNNACFPQLYDTQTCWADSHTLILPVKKSRTKEETDDAVKFMFYASDKGGITWAESGQIPASSTANQSDKYKNMKGYNVIKELDNAQFAPKASHYYNGIKTDLQSALDGYWTGQVDLDTAYENLETAVKNNLD